MKNTNPVALVLMGVALTVSFAACSKIEPAKEEQAVTLESQLTNLLSGRGFSAEEIAQLSKSAGELSISYSEINGVVTSVVDRLSCKESQPHDCSVVETDVNAEIRVSIDGLLGQKAAAKAASAAPSAEVAPAPVQNTEVVAPVQSPVQNNETPAPAPVQNAEVPAPAPAPVQNAEVPAPAPAPVQNTEVPVPANNGGGTGN